MRLHEAQCLDSAYACQVYTRTPLLISRGAGMYVWDDQDRQYLDFCSGGRAVNALGHCHPAVVAAIQKPAATLLHTSNDFYYTRRDTRHAESPVTTLIVKDRALQHNPVAALRDR